jgi:hypothetical protein
MSGQQDVERRSAQSALCVRITRGQGPGGARGDQPLGFGHQRQRPRKLDLASLDTLEEDATILPATGRMSRMDTAAPVDVERARLAKTGAAVLGFNREAKDAHSRNVFRLHLNDRVQDTCAAQATGQAKS